MIVCAIGSMLWLQKCMVLFIWKFCRFWSGLSLHQSMNSLDSKIEYGVQATAEKKNDAASFNLVCPKCQTSTCFVNRYSISICYLLFEHNKCERMVHHFKKVAFRFDLDEAVSLEVVITMSLKLFWQNITYCRNYQIKKTIWSLWHNEKMEWTQPNVVRSRTKSVRNIGFLKHL